MKKFITIFFPLKLQLNILQLEEYKIGRFINWNLKNLFKRNLHTKRGLILTSKIKSIVLIYFLICLFVLLFTAEGPQALLIFFILILEPFLGLSLAVLILTPYEIYNKYKTINATQRKIKSFKNLKVIAITGSFGKTSTKEVLYQILKSKYKTLRTPESFNTTFGIAKVVDLELDNSYDYFICEMAAYKIGEIKALCNMVPPLFGILTGITTQHFERFGSLANTIKAKFELVDAIKDKNNIVFNLEDENIIAEIKKRNIAVAQNTISIKNISFDNAGSSFDLIINTNSHKVHTLLFGFANIKNILLALNMASKLGLEDEELLESVKNLQPFANRNVLIQESKTTIVNNTYSSNIQSFKEMLQTAKVIKGKKVLVTPGIVELGGIEEEVHKNLGTLSQNVFDEVILVGKNKRTESFAKGLRKNYSFIEDERNTYFKKIEDLKKSYSWVFLENDVTENY